MPTTEPVARTTAGSVRGTTSGGCLRFLGVPFAQPPFGEVRFGAPVRHERWDGVRDALEPAPTAPQPPQGITIIPEPVVDGGDAPACLGLNVFTPDLGAAGLPVLVWIHGGGFTTGTPSSPWYDGRSFARDGVVVVSVGYRLGAEGFLHIDDAAHNRGVLDWLSALRWIQDDIAAFGGDPTRVTVAGQSAGGVAVCTLLGLPQARGSFHRAIAMSGSLMPPTSPSWRRAITAAVAEELGVTPGRDGLASVPPSSLVAAQSVAATADLPDAPAHPVARQMIYQPYIDGDVFPATPLAAMQEGATDHVDLLVGATAEEMNLVAGQDLTDRSFRVPAIRACEARAGGDARTYHYDFRWGAGLGAVHCIDVPFVWDLLDAEAVTTVAGDDPPVELASSMHRSFVDFVTTGDPGWAPYTPDTRVSMVYDDAGAHPVEDALATERERWHD